MMPGAGGDVNTTLPLVLNIVSFVLCCCWTYGLTGLMAIAGVILAIIAMNSAKTGNIQDAQAKAKISLILAIVSMVLGFIAFGIEAALGTWSSYYQR
jgi:hypothetical protein